MFNIDKTKRVFTITGYPNSVKWTNKRNYSALINVADQPFLCFKKLNIPSFWFPITEARSFPLEAFYGVLRVVEQYHLRGVILLHCVAGANRSPTVAYVIYKILGFTDEEINKVGHNVSDLRSAFFHNLNNGYIDLEEIQDLNEWYKEGGNLTGFLLKKKRSSKENKLKNIQISPRLPSEMSLSCEF